MSIPPISPMQAVQLGLAAKAAGEVAASAFSDLLRSAADLLGSVSQTTKQTTPAAAPAQNGGSDLNVLSGQIDSLLNSFGSKLRQLLGNSGIAVPENGLTFTQTPTGLGIVESHPEKSRIEDIVNSDESMTNMFRGILARQQLLQSAVPTAAANASQVHVPR